MDTRCIEPWRQVRINSGGNIGPCCYYNSVDVQGDYNFLALVTDSDMPMNSHMESIRQKMRNNEMVPGCQHCYNAESKGLQSPRTTWENEPKLELEEIFVTLGNICNMACVFCNPTRSSRLASQYNLERGWDPHVDNYINQQLSYVADPKYFGKWPNEEDIWTVLQQLLYEHDVKKLHFSGGEPFANNYFDIFLNNLYNNQELQPQQLVITTNASWKQKSLQHLSNFNEVVLEISVDGVNNTYGIQRYPSRWSEFEKQLQMLQSSSLQAELLFTIVPNSLNAHCLLDWHNYFSSLGKIATHILQDQPHLSIAHLPDDRKALLRQQVEQMTSFSVQDRNNILAELDMPAKKAQVNKLTRLVNTWQLTRHQNIWETIGWRPNEENTNNG